MKRALLALWLLIPSLGWAQDTVWTTADTPSMRFPDADTAGPTFKANERLTVLATEGARIRVMGNAEYGWIPRTAVTDKMPEGADPLGSLGLEGLDLEGLDLPEGVTVTPKPK